MTKLDSIILTLKRIEKRLDKAESERKRLADLIASIANKLDIQIPASATLFVDKPEEE